MNNPANTPTVAFQGAIGSYSHIVLQTLYPQGNPLPCTTFHDVFAAVETQQATLAIVPIDNSIAGRVTDVYMLLPKLSFFIQQEYFLPIRHCLLGIKNTSLTEITEVYSHIHALHQCQNFIRHHSMTPRVATDTAGSAQMISKKQKPYQAAIASRLAAQIYNLDVLASDIGDLSSNFTRFLVFHRQPYSLTLRSKQIISLLITTRHIPGVLAKILTAFATHALNLIKIESYLNPENLQAAQFYIEVVSNPSSESFRQALDEANFFSSCIRILGVYAIFKDRG